MSLLGKQIKNSLVKEKNPDIYVNHIKVKLLYISLFVCMYKFTFCQFYLNVAWNYKFRIKLIFLCMFVVIAEK